MFTFFVSVFEFSRQKLILKYAVKVLVTLVTIFGYAKFKYFYVKINQKLT